MVMSAAASGSVIKRDMMRFPPQRPFETWAIFLARQGFARARRLRPSQL
jgi:hypothetical protein